MKGSIVERSPGKFAIIIEMRDPATGKRKPKWHSFRGSKREAQIECARLISAVKGGTYINPDKTTVATFLDKWLDHMKTQVSPRSHERYAEIAKKNLVPLLGGTTLTKLQPVQISAAYAKAIANGRRDGKGGLSPRTVHHMHRILKQAFGQAVKWQILPRNPCDAVKPPKVNPTPPNTFDMGQTAALIEAMRATRMFVPVLLGVLCGLRRGEIAALRWRNVQLEAATLSVVESAEQTAKGVRYKEPKSGKSRRVDLSATVVEELNAWKARQAQEFLRLGRRPGPETFVVTQATCEPIQPRSLTHEWVRLLATTKLPRIRLHDLRHTQATMLLKSNVHPKIVSERLGHSKVGITLDLYSHILPTMQADAVAVLDAELRAVKKP